MSFSGFQGSFPFPHTLVNGSTAYTLDSLPVGTYQLTATYAAQGNYQANHATAMLTVNPAGGGGPVATSIAIDVPSSIIQNDHNVRAYVAVTAADGSIPTGQVTMSFSGFQGSFPFPHMLVNGSTAYTLDSLPLESTHLTSTHR